jgi:hypothetical protein
VPKRAPAEPLAPRTPLLPPFDDAVSRRAAPQTEFTRRGNYIAATIDTHNALSKDEEIMVAAGLTWSPDGAMLAWVGQRRRVDGALRGARADGPGLRGHGEAPARAQGDVAGLESCRVG